MCGGGGEEPTQVQVHRNNVFILALNLWASISLLWQNVSLWIPWVVQRAVLSGPTQDDIVLVLLYCLLRLCGSFCPTGIAMRRPFLGFSEEYSRKPFLEEKCLFLYSSGYKNLRGRKRQEHLGFKVPASLNCSPRQWRQQKQAVLKKNKIGASTSGSWL